jgi:hypothetical protein
VPRWVHNVEPLSSTAHRQEPKTNETIVLPSSLPPFAQAPSQPGSLARTTTLLQGSTASRYLSSSLPFCVRFNQALPLEIQPYSQAATHDTKPLAKSYLDGSHSHLPSNHFQYARSSLCSVPLYWLFGPVVDKFRDVAF